MIDSDGYPSRDREHLADLQRMRRASMTRIDYMPGKDALAIFQARKARERPNSVGGTNSAVLDAILTEWAELTGMNYGKVATPKSPSGKAGINGAFRAHAHDFEAVAGISRHIAGAPARAYDSGELPQWITRIMERTKPAGPQRVTCNAKRHRDGQPCQAKSEPGKLRCRFHGGRSTGPRTAEGKARALANLRRGSDHKIQE